MSQDSTAAVQTVGLNTPANELINLKGAEQITVNPISSITALNYTEAKQDHFSEESSESKASREDHGVRFKS